MLSWHFPEISLNVLIQIECCHDILLTFLWTFLYNDFRLYSVHWWDTYKHTQKKKKKQQTNNSYSKKWKKENTYHSFNCRWNVPGWPRARSFEHWWRFCTSNSRRSPLPLVRSGPFRRPSTKKKFTSCFTHVPSHIQIPISMCVRKTEWIL